MTLRWLERAFVDSNHKKIATFFVIIIVFFDFTIAHPLPVWALEGSQVVPQRLFTLDNGKNVAANEDIEIADIEESPAFLALLKNQKETTTQSVRISRKIAVVATAYSSSVEETDSDPCTTANGFNVCKNNVENVIAANFLPFGTRVRISELYGERTFTIRDRMNSRYGRGRIDIWMKTKNSARSFGVKRIKMEIVEDQFAANL